MGKNFDFGGWATKANLLCSDGRVIRNNAFEECDGKTVPLIWNHQHDNPDAVLGHALLENRGNGVYAYCTFNDTDAGQNAKLLVQHGDVDQLSIYANKLKQVGRDVIHGVIREVSLVLAGANSGARIDSVVMHSDDAFEEGYIYTGEYLEDVEPLSHSETSTKGDNEMASTKKETTNIDDNATIGEVFDTLTDTQKKAVYAIIGMVAGEEDDSEGEDDKVEHGACGSSSKKKNQPVEHRNDVDDDDDDPDEMGDDETIGDIINTMTDKQKEALYAVLGMALETNNGDNEEGGDTNMKHNAFDMETGSNEEVLTHSEMAEIMDDAKRCGSLADAVLQHGIEHIDYLFPDAKPTETVPGFVQRDQTWVTDVMNAVHKTPFSRIKSVFADITDFDVVAWLKTEMRGMLNEEIARAILVGDGRNNSSNDKINEQNIRPIWTDDDVYTVKSAINVTKATTDDEKAKAFIKAAIKSRKSYKGSGNPVMYMSEDMLTNCLLLEDTNQRVIYDSVDKLATALRVRKIVPVPVMEDLTRVVSSNTHTLAGIYVNLADYCVGADKGGSVNMFDDFDIDYNQQKYLIETRCSGALAKPYSAVAIEFVQPTNEG